MPQRPTIRQLARILLFAAVIGAGTVGGMVVALLAASSERQRTSFGTLETSVHPDLDGRVIVYVPLVDWRVELLDHGAPATIQIVLRGIDRERAGAGLSSSQAAARSLNDVRRDSERVIHSAVKRAVIVSSIGGIAGALLAGGLLVGITLRRRWLLVSPLFGVAMVGLVIAPSVHAVRQLGQQHIEVTSAGGNADELPVVLRFAEQLLYVGEDYERHYATALRSIGNITSFAGSASGTSVRLDGSALVISDLHDNAFVLDAFREFAGSDTVFAVGDFVQVGARVEERLAEHVASLGARVVAVSGNHDTPEYMASLADAGAHVLDAEAATTTVQGQLVAGYPDPLERDPDSNGRHRLRVYGTEYQQQRRDFLAWWDAFDERPDVVLVHQHGFAHALLDHLEASGDEEPLVVLTGHDHEPHVHVEGQQVIVDAGTLGAGGLAAVGEQEASFARLNYAGSRIESVDVISIEPLTGRSSSRRTLLPRPRD